MKPSNEPLDPKIYNLYCENLACKKFICRSDGKRLLVENLEVEIKFKSGRTRNGKKKTLIDCPHCGFQTAWWRAPAKSSEGDKDTAKDAGKFTIFKSRF